MNTIKSILFPPLHKEGFKFVTIFLITTLIFTLFYAPLFYVGLGLTIWCYYFFRDPVRYVPQVEGIVISPADGKVCAVDKAIPPKELGLSDIPMTRIGVFMNVFDCHVNRAPIAGTVTKIAYHKGKFLNASLDKASQKNERNSLIIRADCDQQEYGVVQIAGLVARRILCETNEQASLKRGQRFGIIRFGSRVDIYVPDNITPCVGLGQTCYAGETVLATANSDVQFTFEKI